MRAALRTRRNRQNDEQTRAERFYYASQGKLIWRAFIKNKLAVTAIVVLAILYTLAIFADFFAPYQKGTRLADLKDAPPTRIRIHAKGEGLQRPFVYALERKMNTETYLFEYTEDKTQKHVVRFFTRGEPYEMWELFPSDLHLFGVEGSYITLFGTDSLNRDMFSRILFGARISLFIGFGGVFISFTLGCLLGGLSGYFGGVVDEIIQRTIDLLLSIPKLPLWIGLAAAVPRNWTAVKTYFAITLVLAVVGWSGLARVVRGKLLSLREEEFALAAKAAGAGELRIILRHLLPNFLSYLIVNITLAIPGMILGETALSFIGLGMQAPAVSWGVLLKGAQDIVSVAYHPWKLIPVLFVIVTVLMFNFVGDGLRDAADPYSK